MKKLLLMMVLLSLGRIPAARAQLTLPPPVPATGPACADTGCATGCTELPLPLPGPTKKCCQTPPGHFLNTLMAPLRLACGGPRGERGSTGLCPEDLARLTPARSVSPAEVAAAKIKADEAGANSRRAAIRYLGTVDGHYYPEAEAALIAGLRADRSEFVRIEAALSLGNGYCCTHKALDALSLVVAGSDADGNPAETSERVKAAALEAMQHCLARPVEFSAPNVSETLPAMSRGQPARPGFELTSYLTAPETQPTPPPPATFSERTFAETFGAPKRLPSSATGQRNLYQLWVNAASPRALDSSPDSLPSMSSRVSGKAAAGLAPIGVIPGQ